MCRYEEIMAMLDAGMNQSQVANELGLSRQRISQIVKIGLTSTTSKRGRPRKSTNKCENETDASNTSECVESNRTMFPGGIDIAIELAYQELKAIFGCLIKNLRYEHSDSSGYWFTFELINDSRRQTWSIRPEAVRKVMEVV